MSKQINASTLARYQPLNSLNPDNLRDALNKLTTENISAGQALFKKGDTGNCHYYLLDGEVDLLGDTGLLKTIKSNTPDSFNPIAHILPRTITAKAKTDSTIFKIDSNLVDIMLTWEQTGSYQVSEFELGSGKGDDDWMNRILRTEAFHRIPPANIQAIFMRMKSLPVKAGEKIINQGDAGDYFYIIKKGRCLITRSMPEQAKEIKLAELKDGDSFGEEALISDTTRNASATMLTSGTLNRLSKDDFIELLNEPLLDRVDYEQAEKLIHQGAQWLDVRLPAEHKLNAITGSENIPLIFLRMKVNTLDQNKAYILYCDTGRRSSAASYLLNERGFTSYVLKEGVGSAPTNDRAGQH